MPGTLKGVRSRSGSLSGDGLPERTHLFLVMDAARPLAGGARFALDGVYEVTFVRSATLGAERVDGGKRLTIGVPDPLVSTRHASLVSALGAWVAIDQGSTNGTFVDGAPLAGRSGALRDGAILEMGTTLFVLRTSLPTPEDTARDVVSAALGRELGMATLIPEYDADLGALTRVATSGVPVLLLGESGSGKELIARAVHALSRRPGELVPINCGALADSLVEGLLFGHTKGSFSGALRDELGLVRSSHQGSLFLDEIGDMPRAAQASLLRVLQEGEVVPVGATRAVKVDLRILAATHRRVDLLDDTPDFRRDLYARLAGYTHEIPPMRDRLEDLGLLVGDVLRKVARAPDGVCIDPMLVQAMLGYEWPLNVRELEHALASATVLAGDAMLGVEHLPATLRTAFGRASLPPPSHAPREMTEEDERIRTELVSALTETRGNVSAVARALGRTRMQIHRWMQRFGIDVERFRGP